MLENPVCLAAQYKKCQNRLTGLFNQKELGLFVEKKSFFSAFSS